MTNPFKAEGTQRTLDIGNDPQDVMARQSSQKAEGVSGASLALAKSNLADERERKQMEKLNAVTNLDWKNIPPPVLAQVLTQMPFKGSGQEPDYFLQPWQALVFAMRCYELGLSPFSNEVWFNPKNNKVNVTFEGKLKLARKQGLNLGPPRFTRIPADAEKPLVAYKCTMKSPTGECEYTATLREWMVPASPVWKSKSEHMLQLRAAEKCLSFASGIGSSELMGEQDLQTGPEVAAVMSGVESTEFTPAPPEVK